MNNSGEAGFKLVVVLMILGLGFLGREYLVVREKLSQLEQAYIQCTDVNHWLENQNRNQAGRLQEMEESARQFETALQALQIQNRVFILERDAVQGALLELEAAQALLEGQLVLVGNSVQYSQPESEQDLLHLGMGSKAGGVFPKLLMSNHGRDGGQNRLWFILGVTALSGYAAGRFLPRWTSKGRPVSVRMTRDEARWIRRLRRAGETPDFSEKCECVKDACDQSFIGGVGQ
jgi:hypothetical protein